MAKKQLTEVDLRTKFSTPGIVVDRSSIARAVARTTSIDHDCIFEEAADQGRYLVEKTVSPGTALSAFNSPRRVGAALPAPIRHNACTGTARHGSVAGGRRRGGMPNLKGEPEFR